MMSSLNNTPIQHATILELLDSVLQVQAERMLQNVKGARAGRDPEHVHDIRVATRRSRFAIRLMREFLDPDATSEVLSQLKEIARLLGSVRDVDVLVGMVKPYMVLLHLPKRDRNAVLILLNDLRKPARAELRRKLTLLRIRPLARKTMRLATMRTVPMSTPTLFNVVPQTCLPDQPVYEVAPLMIAAAVEKTQELLAALSNPPIDTELHTLRIGFKRLRYTCEYFRDILSDPIESSISSCIGFQDILGLHQDACMGLESLRQFREADEENEALHQTLELLESHLRTIITQKRLEFSLSQGSIPELLNSIVAIGC